MVECEEHKVLNEKPLKNKEFKGQSQNVVKFNE